MRYYSVEFIITEYDKNTYLYPHELDVIVFVEGGEVSISLISINTIYVSYKL